MGPLAATMWYRDRKFWRPFVRRYLPGTAVANLLWEIAQLPLYTIWTEKPPGLALSAVVHCTAGDVLIALCVLFLGMAFTALPGFPEQGFLRVTLATTLIGLAYLVFSEWLNTAVRASWAYAPSMPIVPLLRVGLTPFVQWVLLPPLILLIAFRGKERQPGAAAAPSAGRGAAPRRGRGTGASR